MLFTYLFNRKAKLDYLIRVLLHILVIIALEIHQFSDNTVFFSIFSIHLEYKSFCIS